MAERTMADALDELINSATNGIKTQLDNKLDKNATVESATKATQDSEGNVINTTYAKIDSPALTGTPTAPTVQDLDDNSTKLATTEFVADYIRRLLSADLATIETIYQLSVALNQDKNFSEAVVQALSEKLTQSQADGRYLKTGDTAEAAKKDANGNVITTTYATKTELSNVSVSKLNDRVEFYNGTQYKGFLDTGNNFAGTWGGIASGFGLIASNDGTTQHSGINFGPHYASIWASNRARGGSDAVEIALYIDDYSKGQCVKITAPGGLWVNGTRVDQ